MKIFILGAGAMGEAILKGLVRGGFTPADISVSRRNEDKLGRIAEASGVTWFATNADAMRASGAVILCCKPRDLDRAAAELEESVSDDALIVSTLAGVPIEALQRKFSRRKVVRLIPNIASSLNAGVTVWVASRELSREQARWVRGFVQSLGRSIEAEDEKLVDLATPLSGAGPAFTAYFMDSLVEAAVQAGIPRPLAVELIGGTIAGSIKLIEAEGWASGAVRARVTSPGGLTAECIAALERRGFNETVLQAVAAGRRKTIEMKEGASAPCAAGKS